MRLLRILGKALDLLERRLGPPAQTTQTLDPQALADAYQRGFHAGMMHERPQAYAAIHAHYVQGQQEGFGMGYTAGVHAGHQCATDQQ